MDSELTLDHIGQIAHPVTDLLRATAFYTEVLGLRLLYEVPRMAFFDLGETRLMLAQPEGGPHATGSILYFSVDDLEDVCGTLEERGVSFDQGPTLIADMGDEELWMAFFKDSEGNQLALMSERPKP